MKKFYFFLSLLIAFTLSIGQVWAADSGLSASDGVFIIDFYDSDKLTSTNGTGLSSSNYSNFVKVASGLTKTNVVTGASVTGTVQYGKNGGLTAGTSSGAGESSHYVTFNIGTDYAVNKVTLYATAYESGRWKLNGNAADSGELGSKGASFANVTSPLVWNNLGGVTSLTFKKDNGSNGNQKRLTIYTIVCEYSTSGSGSTKTDVTDAQLKWSAASATVTMNANDNVFPTLTNSLGLNITYESTTTAVATIDANGTVSLVKAGSTTIKAVFAENDTYNAKTVSYTLTVNPAPLTPIPGAVVDTLTSAAFTATSTSYTVFSNKQATNVSHSEAVYVGKTARGGSSPNFYIQLNSISSGEAGRGIASSTSGGTIKRVEVIWAGSNNTSRSIYVYGSHNAYTGSETSKTGTQLGTIPFEENATSAYLDIDDSEEAYEYIQITASGAMYASEIRVSWIPAQKYAVNVTDPATGTGTLVVKDGDDAITSGAEFAEGKTLTVEATPNSTNHYIGGTIVVKNGSNVDVTTDVLSGTTLTVPAYAITVSASFTPTYAINLVADGGSIALEYTADGAAEGYAKAGTEIMATATADGSHVFGALALSDNAVNPDIDENIAMFTMPAGAVTVTATFNDKPCTKLTTPSVSVSTKTYNSATLAWAAIDNAVKYVVKFDGVEHETTALSYEATELEAATSYAYQVKAIAEDGQSTYCESDFSASANVTTENLPEFTLTLSENGETSTEKYGLNVLFDLPTSSSQECSGKVFVGWSENANADSEEDLISGQYSISADKTIYAVYAKENKGDVSYVKLTSNAFDANATYIIAAAQTTSVATLWYFNSCEKTDQNNSYGYMTTDPENNAPIQFQLSGTASALKIREVSGAKRYLKGLTTGNFQMSASEQTLTLSNAGAIGSTSNYVLRHNYNSGNGGLRWYSSNTGTIAYLYKVEQEITYSNYSTTCVAPLTDPTFSLSPVVAPVAGKYNEAINVVITNNASEGIIYYTLDGTEPTSESIEYTGAIALNTCGDKTIKAIVISATNQSGVTSATYTMEIPIPANSQTAPYSPTQAREVIDGGCYDGTTIMYVKGVVTTCSAWNSDYGNYDVVVRNIGDVNSETFTYYHMYAAANKTKFTEDEEIVAGDTILAAGVLTLYGSTYEFANNSCYMIEHKKLAAAKTPIANEPPATPYSVAQAINFIDNSVTYDLSEEVYVKGVVTAINTSGTKYIDVKDAGQTNSFRFYNCTLGSFEVAENDTIIGKGILYKHNSTYEFNGCTVTAVTVYVAPVIAVTSIELDETAISLKEGVSMTLTATVNPNDASNKAVSWESSNPAIASVSEDGEVTAVAEGIATITVKSVAYPTISATCTVNVIDASARVLPNAVFKKVTATADITDGQYLIVYEGESSTVAFDGALETLDAVGNKIEVTTENGYIIAPADAVFTISVSAGTLKSYSGKYIGVTSNSNGLKQEDASSEYYNTFAIDANENAVITASFSGSSMTLRFNKASNQDRFRYYKNGQENIQLYKMLEPENVRADLAEGKWGTICPKQTVMLPRGASFFSIGNVEIRDGKLYKVYFNELGEEESLEAGKPYVYIAEGEKITGVKTGSEYSTDNGQSDNGLIGVIAATSLVVNDENRYYVISNNQLRRCAAGKTYSIPADRAYIDVQAGIIPVTPTPGRRCMTLTTETDIATGSEEITVSETPQKVVIDDILFIIRSGKMYDMTGNLIK